MVGQFQRVQQSKVNDKVIDINSSSEETTIIARNFQYLSLVWYEPGRLHRSIDHWTFKGVDCFFVDHSTI